MTDQSSSQSSADSARSESARQSVSGSTSEPNLPRFDPLPPTEQDEDYDPNLTDDEPSPFISDRIKSGHLGKPEVPNDIWIWAALALVLFGVGIFGLTHRDHEKPTDVQPTDAQPTDVQTAEPK